MTRRVGFSESDTTPAYKPPPTAAGLLQSKAIMTDKTTDALAWISERGAGELAEKMGIQFTEFSLERAVATMPVEGNRQ